MPDRPCYDRDVRPMLDERGARGADFARQILDTAAPFLAKPAADLDVLDVGCGYGQTAVELARRCRRVVGIEPSRALFQYAAVLGGHVEPLYLSPPTPLPQGERGEHLEFRHQSIYDGTERDAFDLVVLDNVFEHLPDQPRALAIMSAAMRVGGVAFLLVPNKLWPIEVHYGLPLLSYLPLRLANRYLRWSGRGADYTDASYAPTWFSLNRMLRQRPELSFRYVLPAHLELATAGRSLHYRLGAAMIRRFPWLWAVSKSLLVIVRKEARDG